MGKGYAAKILWVDLSLNEFTEEELGDGLYEDFLGGYGLAAKIIFDHQEPGLGPLDPKNILALMSGLLTNGRALFNGRWMLAGKSPLTGTWGDSNCGGDLAPAIKDTGYDGIFFIGKSEKPVYLLIDGDNKKLMDASGIWGKKDAIETENHLRALHGDEFRVAALGKGGENCSLISGVVNAKGRLAARSGLGALMGSKNLKAVCLRGDAEITAYDPDTVWKHSTTLLKDLVDNLNDFGKTMKNCGTAGTLVDSAESGDSPIKNWLGTGPIDFPAKKAEKINAFSVTKYETKKYHCYGCPFGCGGICNVPGKKILKETHRPEYETICGFGAQLLNDDVESIFLVNEMLNRAGIDTISCATTVDWAFDIFNKGYIDADDTGGLELLWGRSDAVVTLVKQIIEAREYDDERHFQFGYLLRDGLQRAIENLDGTFGKEKSKKIDGFRSKIEEAAMMVHGQELPMHDSRLTDGGLGLGVGYEVEPTPGRHTSTFPGIDSYMVTDRTRTLNVYYQKLKFQAKFVTEKSTAPEDLGDQLKCSSCGEDVINGLGLCNFGLYLGPKVPFVEWANATTGWDLTIDDYLRIGRRIKTVRHAFNLREKVDPALVKMPDRARGNPPLKVGPNAYSGNVLRWDDAKAEYYNAMGWDRKTAVPLEDTLDELNLPEVKKALYGK